MTLRKISTIIFLTLLGVTIVHAQEGEATVKCMRVSSVSLGPGFFMQQLPGFNTSDFKLMAPESLLLTENLNDFSHHNFGMRGNGGSGSFSTLLEISFRDKEGTGYRHGPILRFGLTYFGGMGFSHSLFKSERMPYDTLFSSGSGQVSYRDSVFEKNYDMRYQSNQLHLDVSVIYRTNSKSLLSAYAGVGVSAGMAVFSETTIAYYENNYSQNVGGSSGYNDYRNYDSDFRKEETFSNTQNFAMQVYVPIGIALKLAKKREFFRDLHLFTEFRPGLGYFQIPELRAGYTRPFYQQTFGLRYAINKS